MSHVALVLAHHLPEQLGRLVARVRADADLVVLHLDARADASAYLERAGAPDVLLQRRRLRTAWGSPAAVLAPLLGVEEALAAGAAPSHFTQLTGQDYPIKPGGALRRFLAGHEGRSFIRHVPLPAPGPGNGLEAVERRHVRLPGGRSVALPGRRRVPRGHVPHKGSTSWTLAREHAEWLLRLIRDDPRYLRFWNRTRSPDELFFPTALANSPHRDALASRNLHEIDWSAGGAHPATVTGAQLPRLRASPAFFTRKVDPRVDAAVLDAIDHELLEVR